MKRKLLGILLVIALVTALIPAGALAAPERIDVTFSYSKGSSIVLGPVEISVHAGLASEYGVGSASTSPTVLDAVVAAHKIRYGDDFTQATAADYVNAGLTALFGDSGYGGHIINGNYSSDAASSAVLRAGDAVDTLLYDALTWGDYHAAFYRNDMLTRELAAEVGETVALTVKGFNIMMGSSSSARVAMPNLDVGTIDPSSGLFTTKHLTTDSEGRVTVSFDAAGTYILATNGPSNSNPVVPAWCAVTVTAATSPEEQARFIAEDKDALDVTYTDGQNLSLPTKGSSGRTMISWTSSEPAVIGDTGVVNKQMTERSVTLTATISCGSAEPQTKTFSITVPALTSFEISEKLAAAKGALTPLSLAPVEFSGLDGGSYPYEGSEAVDTNILTKARGIVNAAAPGVSVALSDSFTGDAYVAADGTIRYPSTSGPHYAEVTFALSLGGETQEKRVTAIEISKHAKTKAEAIQTAMDALTISDLLNNNPDENSITTTLKLPVGKTVGIKTDWSSDNPAVTVGTGTSSSTGQLHTILRPSPAEGDATVSLTATFDYAAMSIQYGICDAGPMPALAERQKTFTIKVPALSQSEYDAQRKLLLDGIAEDKARINNMTDDPNLPWLVSDLLAYRTAYPSTPYVISDANIRKDLDAIVNNAAATNLPGDLAKYIIALRALGYDARSTVASDGIARDIVKKLTDLVDAKDPGVTGLYTLPYVLTALQQHSTYATQAQIDYLIQSALNSADATGGWGGEFYFEDATATMVSALAAYYDTNGSVKAAIDKALSRLENAQNPDGTLGGYPDNKYNAAATGLAIAAFVSVGRDPAAVQNAGRSLVDGLYLFRNTGGYAFTPTDSSFATEQGFRGLLSADRFAASEAAYRIYDFSANDMNAATASPAQYCPVVFSLNPAGAALVLTKGGVSQAEAYPGVYDLDAGTYSYSVTKSGYETKTGTFPVTADDAATHTRKEISVSLSAVQTGGTSDISVDVYVKTHGGGCNNAYTYKSNSGKFTNLASGTVTLDAGSSVFDAIDKLLSREQIRYIEKTDGYISSVDGLAEFDHGPNSGWLYMVNGVSTTKGSREYVLTADATVILFYTDDYANDIGAETWGGAPAADEKSEIIAPRATVSGDSATASVTEAQIRDVIAAVSESGAKSIVIAPTGTGDATGVTVTLPARSAKQVAGETTASLVMQTGRGTVEIPNGTLGRIAGGAKGDDLTIAIRLLPEADAAKAGVSIADSGASLVFEVTITSGGANITTFGDGGLILFFPVGEGFTVGTKYTVFVVSDGGDVEEITGECVTKDGEKAVKVTVNHLSVFVVTRRIAGQVVPLPFTDTADHWALEAIRYVYENGLMTGVTATEFQPDSPLSRAMLVTILYRFEREPAVASENPFADVEPGRWYTDAILWANENGIAEGYGDRRFGATELVTREQMATILLRYANWKTLDTDKAAAFTAYADAGEISDWAQSGMQWAIAEGLLTGRTATTLAPKGGATRAEAATVLTRFIKTIANRT